MKFVTLPSYPREEADGLNHVCLRRCVDAHCIAYRGGLAVVSVVMRRVSCLHLPTLVNEMIFPVPRLDFYYRLEDQFRFGISHGGGRALYCTVQCCR